MKLVKLFFVMMFAFASATLVGCSDDQTDASTGAAATSAAPAAPAATKGYNPEADTDGDC